MHQMIVVDQDDVILGAGTAKVPKRVDHRFARRKPQVSSDFGPEKVLQALPRIIEDLRERGSQIVDLDSMALEFQEIAVTPASLPPR